MAKQDVTVSADVPDGYEVIGDFVPGVSYWSGQSLIGHIPLRKVEPVKESRWHPTGLRLSYKSKSEIPVAFLDLPLVRVNYENGAPVSVALEPAEGGG